MFHHNRILVVDDDRDHISLIEDCLRRGQVTNQVIGVGSAKEAFAYLNGDGEFANREIHPLPCLILLDLKLPGESGFEVLRWVRDHPELKKLPVVVLTGSKDNEDLSRAYDLGANSYLIKPFRLEEMRALVKSIDAYWVLLAQKPRL